MTGKWKLEEIANYIPDPQAHWLNETEEAKAWTPVVLDLTRDLALSFVQGFLQYYDIDPPVSLAKRIASLGPQAVDDDVLKLFSDLAGSVRMGPETIMCLLDPHLSTGGSSDDSDRVEITILVETRLLSDIQHPAEGHVLKIMAVGPSTAVDVYGKPQDSWFNPPGGGDSHLKNAKAIVAIVDDGIAFANSQFRLSAERTRIEFFWAMETPNNRVAAAGHPAKNFWHKHEIDDFLKDHQGDEEAIYRATGLLDAHCQRRQPLWFSRSHGTHVLDIAAGEDISRVPKECLERFPIIAVQLPSDVVEDTSGSLTAHWLELALNRILCEAEQLGGRIASRSCDKKIPPLLLNFSFGVFAGPKNGTGRVEEKIAKFIESYRKLKGNPECHVVLPAGNSFQSRTVARLKLRETSTAEINWRVLPDDKTASFVHIWLPPSKTRKQQISVRLIPPCGGPPNILSSQLGYKLDWLKKGTVHARICHQRRAWTGEDREWVVIAIRPTAADDGRRDLVPQGLWRIEVESCGATPSTEVELTVQRDDSIRDHRRRGRQSYFEHLCHQDFDPVSGRPIEVDSSKSPIKREGTLSAYASLCAQKGVTGPDDGGACSPVVVGGYGWADGKAAEYSASGPVASGRQGPDLAAVSETSAGLPGVLAAGTYNSSVILQRGTSVAAPALLRALAEEIDDGGGLESLLQKVRTRESDVIQGPHGDYPRLIRDATKDEARDDTKRLGIGRLAPPEPPPHRERIEP